MIILYRESQIFYQLLIMKIEIRSGIRMDWHCFFYKNVLLHKKMDSFGQMSLSIEYQTKNTKPLAWWEVLKWPIVLRFSDFFFVQSKEGFYCFFQTFFEHIFSLQFNV